MKKRPKRRRGIHAAIVCNGEPARRVLARRLARTVDLIIAADGGANVARRAGIRPHVIIGDLDSVTLTTRKFFAAAQLIHVARQDNTDLEKALDYALAAGVKKATLLGATGKRLDHTLGNLSVIWRYAGVVDIRLLGNDWCAVPVGRMKRLRAKRGTVVSLLPFGTCTGITLRGLRYPLANATMRVGEIGVSNVVERPRVSIEVKNGNMLLVVPSVRDPLKVVEAW